MKEALFYENINGKVRCALCNHHCIIMEGKRGICAVRENRQGRLYSLVYGKSVAAGVDPIEKKPFFHFYPGSKAYSVAIVGCNFRCLNCQNWEIFQMSADKEGRIVGDEFIKDVREDISWHVTTFYPAFKLLDVPSTPVKFLRMARDIGLKAGLRYVYERNIPAEGGKNTYCYNTWGTSYKTIWF
jgi:pyruvate-formate lyase-activating enzyme